MIEKEDLKPFVVSSCADTVKNKCVRKTLYFINFVTSFILLILFIPLTLIFFIIAFIWKYVCCCYRCNNNVNKIIKTRNYFPSKPNKCCPSCSRQMFSQWRLHLILIPESKRGCCYKIQHELVLFYQVMDLIINFVFSTHLDLFNSLSNDYGDYFPLNSGLGVSNSDRIIELLTSNTTHRNKYAIGTPVATCIRNYTKQLGIFENTLTPIHKNTRFIVGEYLNYFYKEFCKGDGGYHFTLGLNHNEIHENISKHCNNINIIPSFHDHLVDKKSIIRYASRLLYHLTTNGQLNKKEEDDMITYTNVYMGVTQCQDFVQYLLFGYLFARNIVHMYDVMRDAYMREDTPICLQAILKKSKELNMSGHDGISNCFRPIMANINSIARICHQGLEYLYSNPNYWLPIYEENPLNFIKEITRLHTVVPAVTYSLKEDQIINIGGNDYNILKSTPLTIPINVYHRDPKIFGGQNQSQEYANTFDPKRENLDLIITWDGIDRYQEDNNKDNRPVRGCMGRVLALHTSWYIIDSFKPNLQK